MTTIGGGAGLNGAGLSGAGLSGAGLNGAGLNGALTAGLFPRVLDVDRGVALGHSTDQIAWRAGISRWTVVDQLRRGMLAWCRRSRLDAAVHVVHEGNPS